MAWVYLDDQFPDHPKVVTAGDEAAWLFVCGLAYCKRYNTGGRIPKRQVPKLTGHRQPMKLAAKLTAAPSGYESGLWEDDGDDFLVHDFTDWNKPQASRSEAGRKAARARWSKAKDDAIAHADASESHSETDALPTASECPPPQPTEDPTKAEPLPAVTGDAGGGASAEASDLEATIALAASLVAWAETGRRDANGEIGNPDGYQRSRVNPLLKRHEATWRAMLDGDPGLSARQLADAAVGRQPAESQPAAERVERTYDEQQRVMLDEAERGMAKARELASQPLPDDGIDRVRALKDRFHLTVVEEA